MDKLPGNRNPECDTVAIFTDGACEASCGPQAHRAGFAIVIDTSRDDYERIEILENFAKSGTIPDCFSVHTTAPNWGNPFLGHTWILRVSSVRLVNKNKRNSVKVKLPQKSQRQQGTTGGPS